MVLRSINKIRKNWRRNLFSDKLRPIFWCRLILLFAVCVPLTVAAQNKDDDTLAVESSLVVVNVTVTDQSGKPVRNLDQTLFKILEDGQEQPLEFYEAEKTPFAAVILIDTSGSMEERISMARSAAINFLDGLRADDVAAIYNFDTKVTPVQEFSDRRDITDKIFDLKADGGTALNDAIITAARELAKRGEKRRAIIVLSDGADNHSSRSSDQALKAAAAANSTIYTIDMAALEKSTDHAQSRGALKNFAEKSGGVFIAAPGGAAMREAFKNIVAELGVQYTLGYEPLNHAKDGKWRTIEVRIAKPNLVIRTRKGYNAPKPDNKRPKN